jgi:transposase
MQTSLSRLRPVPPFFRRLTVNENGFVVNPVAATIFLGLVLIVITYSALDLSGALHRLGPYGPLLPMLVIAWLLVGIYFLAKRLKKRSARIRIKGPLFMRSLMDDCLERTCGVLRKRLEAPEISSRQILNEILTDKMLHICATDCLRFSDIRRQIEGCGLKGTRGLEFSCLFQTEVEYGKRELPGEIRQVVDTVARSRPNLEELLERLKRAHRNLCTGTGDILTLLPPDPKKVERLRAVHRYRPPTPQRAKRMAFALETLAYLKATRHENVNPMDRRRYDTVAAEIIPRIADAVNVYKSAWQDLVDAYEKPRHDRENP